MTNLELLAELNASLTHGRDLTVHQVMTTLLHNFSVKYLREVLSQAQKDLNAEFGSDGLKR